MLDTSFERSHAPNTKKQSTTELPPEDMTDDELKAAIDFHTAEAARFRNEAAKIWRLRVRIDGGIAIDKQMLAELHERRAARISPASAAPVKDHQWFELALRYLRGDPTLTDLPFAEGTVFADFLLFWDAQTPHFRSVIKSVFQAAPYFTAAATAAPSTKTIEAFRDLKPGWDSYNGLAISTEAIEIALRLAPLLPDWQPVPRSDGGIQFERGDDEICIDAAPVAQSDDPQSTPESR